MLPVISSCPGIGATPLGSVGHDGLKDLDDTILDRIFCYKKVATGDTRGCMLQRGRVNVFGGWKMLKNALKGQAPMKTLEPPTMNMNMNIHSHFHRPLWLKKNIHCDKLLQSTYSILSTVQEIQENDYDILLQALATSFNLPSTTG